MQAADLHREDQGLGRSWSQGEGWQSRQRNRICKDGMEREVGRRGVKERKAKARAARGRQAIRQDQGPRAKGSL